MKSYLKENSVLLALLGTAIALFLYNWLDPIFLNSGANRRLHLFIIIIISSGAALLHYRWGRIWVGVNLLISPSIFILLTIFGYPIAFKFQVANLIALTSGLLLLISKRLRENDVTPLALKTK